MKCPNCKTENIVKLTPPANADGFMLCSFSKSTKQILPNGYGVDLYKCNDCGFIWMMDQK